MVLQHGAGAGDRSDELRAGRRPAGPQLALPGAPLRRADADRDARRGGPPVRSLVRPPNRLPARRQLPRGSAAAGAGAAGARPGRAACRRRRPPRRQAVERAGDGRGAGRTARLRAGQRGVDRDDAIWRGDARVHGARTGGDAAGPGRRRLVCLRRHPVRAALGAAPLRGAAARDPLPQAARAGAPRHGAGPRRPGRSGGAVRPSAGGRSRAARLGGRGAGGARAGTGRAHHRSPPCAARRRRPLRRPRARARRDGGGARRRTEGGWGARAHRARRVGRGEIGAGAGLPRDPAGDERAGAANPVDRPLLRTRAGAVQGARRPGRRPDRPLAAARSRHDRAHRPRSGGGPLAGLSGPGAGPAHRPRAAPARRPRPARGPGLDVRRLSSAFARARGAGGHRRLRRRSAVGRCRLGGPAVGGAAPT